MTFTTVDPEMFRTEVYRSRWYVDPLPADDTWPATDDKWPSVSTVKKAWSKPFRKKLPGDGPAVPLDAYWAAEFTVDNLAAVTALGEDRAAAMELIATAGRRTLTKASDRGSGVHTVLEDLAAGREVTFTEPEVTPYVPGCREFIEQWSPEFVGSEFVVINRTAGFGGTCDVALTIDVPTVGRALLVADYKSRGSDHGCYEEEVAQIGGYASADYMIVQGATGPERRSLPEFEAGLIVSLTHEGCRLYLVDLESAKASFNNMLASWHHQRDGQKVARKAHKVIFPAAKEGAAGDGEVKGVGDSNPERVGSNAPDPAPSPSSTLDRASSSQGPSSKGDEGATRQPEDSPAPDPARLAWCRERVDAIKACELRPITTWGMTAKQRLAGLWSEVPEIPTFPKGGPRTDAEIDVIAGMCDLVEMEFELPFGTPDPTLPETTKATSNKRGNQ